MKFMLPIWFLAILIGGTYPLSGQEANTSVPSSWQDSLSEAGHRLQNGEDARERRKASNDIADLLGQVLRSKGSWDMAFDMIPQVSVLTPKDGSFRILTWQLFLDPDHYQHRGFIQWKSHPDHPVVLQDRSDEYVQPESAIGSPEHWYGAVYYNIRECRLNRRPYWLLFGFDGHSATSQRKVVDVLTVNDDGQVAFGAPVFHFDDDARPREPRHRLVLEYAIGSMARLRYDEHYKMILLDHLMPFADDRSGLGLVNIPDGTYEGFVYKKGIWQHVEKVFHEVMDEAPVDFPVLDGRRNKDIFGQ